MKVVTKAGKKLMYRLLDRQQSVVDAVNEAGLSVGDRLSLIGDLSYIVQVVYAGLPGVAQEKDTVQRNSKLNSNDQDGLIRH